MARETLQSLRARLAETERKLYQAWDENRALTKRVSIADDIRHGAAGLSDADLLEIAEVVIPPCLLDKIERPTKAQIIQVAMDGKLRRDAIVDTSERVAGELGLECPHDDVVSVLSEMQQKINDQWQEIKDLKNRLVDPNDVKELISDIGLDTYPLTQFSVGDPMLALALKAH